jgi:hypothetical protein
MADACPPGRAAAGQGLATSAQLAGAALAALLAAPVYEVQGPGILFAATAAVVAALAAAAWALTMAADRAEARQPGPQPSLSADAR